MLSGEWLVPCQASSIRSPPISQRAAILEGLLRCGPRRVVVAQQQVARLLVADAGDAVVEQRGGAGVVGVVVGVDEVGHLVADAVGGGDLVDGPLDVVTDRGRRVEQDDAVRRRQERRLVGAVGDPVEVALDAADVVALLVERGPERRPRDRRVVGEILGVGWARVRVCLGRRIRCAHAHDREAASRAIESLNSLVRGPSVALSHAVGEMGSPSQLLTLTRPPEAQLLGRQREREVLGRLLDAARSGDGGGPGGARRARRREDRAARLGGRGGAAASGPADRRGRGRDGAPIRGAPTAVLAGPRPLGASAGAPARCAERRLRAECRAGSESVPGRTGGRSACCPRRRRSGRSCASSTTRSGSIVRRRARSRSWPAACWRRRSRSCSPLVSRATRSRGCRSFASSPWGIVMRGRCWSRSCPLAWTSTCWIGSFWRRAATRSRCWSCRVG